MGTTLNGTTPQNTYPSLIKVGDNGALDANLQTLSDGEGNDLPMEVSTSGVNFTGTLTQNGQPVTTPPSGVSGAIQFSDGSAFASDAANLFYDDANNRLGVGTNAPTATTHIKGSGSTSATTSLLVQNSAGVSSLQVLDDTSVFNNGKGAVGSNTAFGSSALTSNTTGSNNTANGFAALQSNTSGTFNTANGRDALLSNTTGSNNTANGYQALLNNSTGLSNTANGFFTLRTNTTGSNNTAIGQEALRVSTGNNNTAVGFQAGDNITTGAGNVCIGSGAEPENATDSNKFVVGTAAINAGAVTTEVIVPDTTWTVRINGANYKIAMLAI